MKNCTIWNIQHITRCATWRKYPNWCNVSHSTTTDEMIIVHIQPRRHRWKPKTIISCCEKPSKWRIRSVCRTCLQNVCSIVYCCLLTNWTVGYWPWENFDTIYCSTFLNGWLASSFFIRYVQNISYYLVCAYRHSTYILFLHSYQ